MYRTYQGQRQSKNTATEDRTISVKPTGFLSLRTPKAFHKIRRISKHIHKGAKEKFPTVKTSIRYRYLAPKNKKSEVATLKVPYRLRGLIIYKIQNFPFKHKYEVFVSYI